MAGNRPRRRNKSSTALRIFWVIGLLVVVTMVLAMIAPAVSR